MRGCYMMLCPDQVA
ncbi:hypothetical protein LINPERPRIM_LOCUS20190 [Linum perenne]